MSHIPRLATNLAVAVLALLGLVCAWAQVARADRPAASTPASQPTAG
jgi:hypothetical protein